MNAERLLLHYERIADTPDAIARLRRFILDLAVRGKLVPQDASDEPASDLLKRIFGAHQLGLALVVILLMLAAILAFIAAAWRLDRGAAWLFVPYAAWVAFASLLNGSIWMLN